MAKRPPDHRFVLGSRLMSNKDLKRADFAWFLTMPTRWIDNDKYGHMNNAYYYSVFENAVMTWLEVVNEFNVYDGSVRCFTVENGCQYHDAVRYPDELECAVRISKIGNSSVRYELGIFNKQSETVAATGFIVDVFVDAGTERPVAIPDEFRQAMESLLK